MASGSPPFWDPPGSRCQSLSYPTAQKGTCPGSPSSPPGWPTAPPALPGGKQTAQGTYVVGGPETAAFKGALGARETSARGGGLPDGQAVPGRVLLSGPMKSERGSRGCSNHRGRGCHLVLDKVLGSGWTAREAAGNRGGLSLRGLALPAPLGVSGQGSRGQGGPRHGAPNSGSGGSRTPSPPPARPLVSAPDSPAWRRQDPGVAAAPGARPGPASRQEAAPRRCLLGPPRSAPPAHFPQEMINSGRGAFPWQPASTQQGAMAAARARSCTLSRAHLHTRGAAHPTTAHAPLRPYPGCPGSLQPIHANAHVRARPPGHACHMCSCFRAQTLTQEFTRPSHMLSLIHMDTFPH